MQGALGADARSAASALLAQCPGAPCLIAPLEVVVATFGESFPELKAKEALIVATVAEEEAAFSQMLTRGVKYFNELDAVSAVFES